MDPLDTSAQDLELGGFAVTPDKMPAPKPGEPGFVTVPEALPPETPGGQKQDVFVVPPHEHDDRDSNRIKERWLLQRSERIHVRLPGTMGATAANYGQCFIALAPCFVRKVQEVHGTLGTDAGAVTVNIEKLTGTTAPGAGTAMLTTTFNMKGTINTVQTGVFDADRTKRSLKAGDRLALKLSGTPTAIADVYFIIEVEYLT